MSTHHPMPHADAGVVSDPRPLADAFGAELLALARRSRDVAEAVR